jgi:hypothetical protein
MDDKQLKQSLYSRFHQQRNPLSPKANIPVFVHPSIKTIETPLYHTPNQTTTGTAFPPQFFQLHLRPLYRYTRYRQVRAQTQESTTHP